MPIITINGFNVQVKWKDGSVTWLLLVAVKSSSPIDLAEFAKSDTLSDESAFKWWVKHTLNKKNRILINSKQKDLKLK